MGHRSVDRALVEAIRRVAGFRQVPIWPLSVVLAGYPETAQQRWAAWRRKQGLAAATPAQFDELVAQVIGFADAVFDRAAAAT